MSSLPARLLGTAAAMLLLGCPAGEPSSGSSGHASPGAPTQDQPTSGDPLFEDATGATGLDFVHFNGRTGDFHFAEMMGPGGAMFDADGDGDLDLYLRQGSLLDGETDLGKAIDPPVHTPPFSDRLYRNELVPSGELAFMDVTTEAVPEPAGYGMGIATGDVDGDGDVDLYLTNYGPNQLLLNQGNGTFEDATASSGTSEIRWSVPAVFFDPDRDGDLDLYVGNYVDLSPATRKVCTSETGARDYCGPSAFNGETDRLFLNRGDGTFEDATAAAGLGAQPGPTLGAASGDFDGDGWPDLYVANDGAPNFLWINRGDGTFEDQALLAGTALNGDGLAEASMGVAPGDFDGDGDEDLFLSHLARETNTLYRNTGGLFADASRASGLAAPSTESTGFGAGWLDLENDGDLDLLVVNGAVKTIEALARAGDPFPLHQRNQLFRHDGNGSFTEITKQAGPAFDLSEVSRGAVFGDVDDDGDEDVLVVNNGGPARLLLNQANDGEESNSWIGLALERAERPAVGARVTIEAGGRIQTRWLRTGGSYASARDPRLLFGLGAPSGTKPGTVQVRVLWPDGEEATFEGLAPNRYHALR